jgi:hypothetical protein
VRSFKPKSILLIALLPGKDHRRLCGIMPSEACALIHGFFRSYSRSYSRQMSNSRS